jgi:hypothetical protein
MIGMAQLIKALPEGYEAIAKEEGALTRARGVKNPGDLMMLALFHLFLGCSLLTVSIVGKATGLGQMSDVAFMNRFSLCGGWFNRISRELMGAHMASYKKPAFLSGYKVLAADASDVREKGRSGRLWRLHYALDLFGLSTDQYRITDSHTGESLKNFDLGEGCLVLADRAYATPEGMAHCQRNGADYLLRLKKNSATLYGEDGEEIDVAAFLEGLRDGQVGEIDGIVKTRDKTRLPVRICAARKTEGAMEATSKRMRRQESKGQRTMSPETKAFNQYTVIITSLPKTVSASQTLETYRLRWQVEVHFKRLKSILDCGELPKRNADSVKAWLNGKLMIALLIESIISKAVSPPQGIGGEEHLA